MTSKAKVDRENQDLTLEQIRVRAAEDRETTLKSMIEKRETILSSIKYVFWNWKPSSLQYYKI